MTTNTTASGTTPPTARRLRTFDARRGQLGALTFARQALSVGLSVGLSAGLMLLAAGSLHAAETSTAQEREIAQTKALDQLRERSEHLTSVRLDRGVPRSLGFSVRQDPSLGDDPVAQSLAFLAKYRDLYRLDDPIDTLFLERIIHGPTTTSVAFGQRRHGVTVEAATLVVQLTRSEIVATSGQWLPDSATTSLALASQPSISPREAERRALEHREVKDRSSVRVIGKAATRIWEPALLAPSDELGETARLVYRIVVRSSSERAIADWVYLVDAHDGSLAKISDTKQLAPPDKDFDIESALGTTSDQVDWFDEIGPLSSYDPSTDADGEGPLAFNFAHTVYNYYWGRFGWPSYDGDDDQIEITLDLVMPGSSASAAAFYNPSSEVFFFGSGQVTLDTVGHEINHGVVEHSSDLEYENQSGALNESFSDLFGALIAGAPLSGPTARRRFPGVNLGIGHVSRLRPYEPDPECDQTDADWNDCGWVHTNDALINNAGVLLIEGGTLNNVRVTGLGRAKAEQLLFEVMTQWLEDCSDFMAMRTSTIEAARLRADFTIADICTVINAFGATGLGSLDTNCDGIEDNVFAASDRDSDGLLDGVDNCPLSANPSQADMDGDGDGDVCDDDLDGDGIDNFFDNCRNVANSNQSDVDGDGIGDLCDDHDGDGVLDIHDNCKWISNWDQSDDDMDGIGNVCDDDLDNDGISNTADFCPHDPLARQVNSDTDRWGDDCDNCPLVANDNQLDIDKDGLGDVCDDDMDGDGVPNDVDNCVRAPNPDQLDFDNNGYGLVCDPGEQKRLWGYTTEELVRGRMFMDPRLEAVRIPIEPCFGGDCPPWLDQGSLLEIEFQLPFETEVRIVDERGFVAAKGGLAAEGILRLSLEPSSRYQAPESIGGSGEVTTERRYFLEIETPDGVGRGEEIEIGLGARHTTSWDGEERPPWD